MKTSTIFRRLTALSVIAGKSSFNIPVINDGSTFIPSSEEHSYDARANPNVRMSKHFNHHRYNCSEKANSSPPKCNSTQQSNEPTTSNVFKKNFEIVCNRYWNKNICWSEYLHLVGLLIEALQQQLEEEPDNKRVIIELKKLKRSYRDSLSAFNQFKQTTCLSPEMIPIKPEFSCYCFPDYTKHLQKKDYRDYDKRLTKSRKLARKNKFATRDFFLRQLEFVEEEKIVKEEIENYEEYSEIFSNLIKAEKALSSPCVEEAAWAIHIALEENNPDLISAKASIIAEANKILDNYHKALDCYENYIGLLCYPDEL